MPYDNDTAKEVRPDALDLAHDKKESQKNGEWHDFNCCEKHEHKKYEVYMPVSVEPYVHAYRPAVKCEGEMKVEPGHHMHCSDECKEFKFTLKQKLSVDIPVKYGVLVHYDKPCAEEEN